MFEWITKIVDGIANIFSPIFGGSNKSAYVEDREHTEMREDTAYQRAVADMRAAGLNPYTIGAHPASSTPSTVNAQTLTNNLQMLGYILDLQNLSLKNKQTTNDMIGDILGFFKKK